MATAEEAVSLVNITSEKWPVRHRTYFGSLEIQSPAPGEEYALTPIRNRRGVIDLGDKRTMEYAITAREIAEDLARELNGDSGEGSFHGVFVAAGEKPTAANRAARMPFLTQVGQQRFNPRPAQFTQRTGAKHGVDAFFELIVVISHRALFESQCHSRPPFSQNEVCEQHSGLWPALALVLYFAVKDGACALPGNLANRPERFGVLDPLHRPVRLPHVLPPTNDPHLSTFTTYNETSILITRSSHILLSAGSFAQ
jgi:hypothetical protein